MATRLPPKDSAAPVQQQQGQPAQEEPGFWESLLSGATSGLIGDSGKDASSMVGSALGTTGLIGAARKAASMLPGKYGKFAKLLAPAAVGLGAAAGQDGDMTPMQGLIGAASGGAGGIFRAAGPVAGAAGKVAQAASPLLPKAAQMAVNNPALMDTATKAIGATGNGIANVLGGATTSVTTHGRGQEKAPSAPTAKDAAAMQQQASTDMTTRKAMVEDGASDDPDKQRNIEMLQKLRESGLVW